MLKVPRGDYQHLMVMHSNTRTHTHTRTRTHVHTHTHTVLDQHLTEYEAIEDMKARTLASKERYISQSVPRPSRRKLVQTRQPSLSGCSPLVKRKISRSKKSSETSKAQVTSGVTRNKLQTPSVCMTLYNRTLL